MTKAQEVKEIRALAERLGPNSYVGPWLAGVLPEVEADIACDLEPAVAPSACRKEVLRLAMEQERLMRLERDLRSREALVAAREEVQIQNRRAFEEEVEKLHILIHEIGR